MRVLLADDQSWLRSALRFLLEHESNVEVVGETEIIRSLPPLVHHLHPDLLFLDWQLSGLETDIKRRQLVNCLRAIDPNLFIIALTNDDDVIACLFTGADAIVNRAEPPEQILKVLGQATGRTMALRSQFTGRHPQM